MPILNDLQKKQVIQREPTKSADYMLECIQKYNNLSLDDFPNMDSNKREYIRKKLNSIPNPNEQKEWSNIAVKLETPSQELLDALNSYILNWETSRPEGNHVDEAWNEVSRIKSLLLEEQSQKEDDDWNNVDTLSQPSLIDHLYKYPNTVHKNEIDDSVWGLVDKENIQEIQNYTTIFPSGLHANEARDILNALSENDYQTFEGFKEYKMRITAALNNKKIYDKVWKCINEGIDYQNAYKFRLELSTLLDIRKDNPKKGIYKLSVDQFSEMDSLDISLSRFNSGIRELKGIVSKINTDKEILQIRKTGNMSAKSRCKTLMKKYVIPEEGNEELRRIYKRYFKMIPYLEHLLRSYWNEIKDNPFNMQTKTEKIIIDLILQ